MGLCHILDFKGASTTFWTLAGYILIGPLLHSELWPDISKRDSASFWLQQGKFPNRPLPYSVLCNDKF